MPSTAFYRDERISSIAKNLTDMERVLFSLLKAENYWKLNRNAIMDKLYPYTRRLKDMARAQIE
jgi:hypothetical protein